MTWHGIFFASGRALATRRELLAAGATDRELALAVHDGALMRVRRGHYAVPDTPSPLLQAIRVGGRLACVSALRSVDVFGFDHERTHVHLMHGSSRLRSPVNASTPLSDRNRAVVQLHWWPLIQPDQATGFSVGVLDALAQSIRCQHPWHALASIDNALHHGVVRLSDMGMLFEGVPQRFAALRDQIDMRSEAGQETVLRCAFREAGLQPELQVTIAGVGRVDFVIEGRLVVEADSRLAHDGWELHVRDRDRDLDLARLGYMSLRPAYNRTMFAAGEVVEAVVHLLAATRGFRTILT